MDSNILIHGKFAFNKVSVLLNEKLAGKQISNNITIDALNLRGDDSWIYAEMAISGMFNRTIVARFKLKTNPTTPEFIIDQLHVMVEGGGLFSTGINFLLKHIFGSTVEAEVQKVLHKALVGIMTDLTSEFGAVDINGLSLTYGLTEYNFNAIDWNETHLSCTFQAKGIINVEL